MMKCVKTIIFIVFCLSLASLTWSAEALKIDSKFRGTGIITKIEGNKIIIKDDSGKETTLVGSTDDKHKIRSFQVGDRVKMEGGKLIKLPKGSMDFPKVENTSPVQHK